MNDQTCENQGIDPKVTKQNTRTMLLLKDLLEASYPHDAEDVPHFWQAVSIFVAHGKQWNPGIEELGVNLVCRFGEKTNLTELPVYTGEVNREELATSLRTIIEIPIKKQHLGSLSRKNLFALSEHITKQHDLEEEYREQLESLFFNLATEIKGSESQF